MKNNGNDYIKAHYWTSQIIIIIIILMGTWSIWKPDGYIVFSDIDFGMNDSTYISRILGVFNSQFSSTNFFNISRLAFITPFYTLSVFFDELIPHFLLRSIIIGSLLISAIGMYKLCEQVIHTHFGQMKGAIHYYGLIIPSLYYALNPWVIIRIQHIFLLAGYAFFPLVLRYFFQLFDDRKFMVGKQSLTSSTVSFQGLESRKLKYTKKKTDLSDIVISIKLAICFGLGCAGIHYFFYYVLTLLFLLLALVFRQCMQQREHIREVLTIYMRKSIILFIIVFLFTSYWLVPYFASTFFLNIDPQNVNVTDTLTMFSRYSDVKNVMYMVSYWWPMFNMNQVLGKEFWFAGGVLLALAGYAVFYRYSWHFYVRLFTWCALIAVVIALGVNTNIINDINIYIVTKTPIVGHIFRDPNKLIGPMSLFISVLICFAVDKISYFLKNSGYTKWFQILFFGFLFASLFFYYKPYFDVFTTNYYAGREVPQEYVDVQDKYIDKGKILWVPTMENMQLSNGLSSYAWNVSDSSFKLKTSGDFHMYASSKPTFTAHEGNHGTISYFHAFTQFLMDMGGAQHLGTLFSWVGFNEVGFHQDVFGQEERQAYNLKVLESQPDMELHYHNDIMRLYDTGSSLNQLSGTNRLIYNTKGLSSILGLLDYKNLLNIQPGKDTLFWGPQRLQSLKFTDADIIVGDDRNEIVLPQLDSKYFSFPSDQINTGNPYTGWAKTMIKTADWSWIIKSNNLQSNDWNYDFGKGIIYTYTSQKLATPSYKSDDIKGKPFVTMDDLLDGFFLPSNPDILQIQYAPDPSTQDTVLTGTVFNGTSGSAIWQTAQSKFINLSDVPPSFIRINAIVSGVRAGNLHFKVKFFDEEKNELQVVYVNKSSADADFTKAYMTNDTAVPDQARYMRIDLMSTNDISNKMYFYIHDFEVSDISTSAVANVVHIPISVAHMVKSKPQQPLYRTFIRLFRSEAGGSFVIRDQDQHEIEVSTKGSDNRFVWVDLGELHLQNTLSIYPGMGLNVINSVVTIPVTEFDAVYNHTLDAIHGNQVDVSTIINSYSIQTSIDFRKLSQTRRFPGSLMNSLTPITDGTLNKQTDILRDGTYKFIMTGYVPKGSKLSVSFVDHLGKTYSLTESSKPPTPVGRSLNGQYSEVKYEDNKYFLQLKPNTQNGWDISSYEYKPIYLPKGSYKTILSVHSSIPNLSHAEEAHMLEVDEINVPKEEVSLEQNLLAYYIMDSAPLSIHKNRTSKGFISFTNQSTNSPQWIVVGLNPVVVKKGQLLVYQANLKSSNVRNFHSKLMFMDSEQNLIKSVITQNDQLEGEEQLFLTIESPIDGIVQPIFLYNGDKEHPGEIVLNSSQLYVVDDLIKLESTALISEEDYSTPVAATTEVRNQSFKTNNSRYLVHNEAYNPIWSLRGDGDSEPLIANILQGSFTLNSAQASGEIVLNRLIHYSYVLFLVVSIVSHLIGFILFVLIRWPRLLYFKSLRGLNK